MLMNKLRKGVKKGKKRGVKNYGKQSCWENQVKGHFLELLEQKSEVC